MKQVQKFLLITLNLMYFSVHAKSEPADIYESQPTQERYLGTYVNPVELTPRERLELPGSIKYAGATLRRPDLVWVGSPQTIRIGSRIAIAQQFDIVATIEREKTMQEDHGFTIEQIADPISNVPQFRLCLEEGRFIPTSALRASSSNTPLVWGPYFKNYSTLTTGKITRTQTPVKKGGVTVQETEKKQNYLCFNLDTTAPQPYQEEPIATATPTPHPTPITKESEPERVYQQAKKIAAIADNVVVKIPGHFNYYPVIHKLVNEGVGINVTLVFTVVQGICLAKLGVAYLSPFVGRVEDLDGDGIGVVRDLVEAMQHHCFDAQILVASLRSVSQVHAAAIIGADIVTVNPDLFKKMVSHPLIDAGMQKFLDDWGKRKSTQPFL